MDQIYINKLVDSLPNEITCRKQPMKIDLILSGGAFNGSFQLGALYFLKEMEKRKYIIINRISGSSIGSVLAYLYLINKLDLFYNLYSLFFHHFKKNKNLDLLKNIKTLFNFQKFASLNKKMYITYNDVSKMKKIIKNKYNDIDDIYETIIKSCFVPYMIDGELVYKDKYIDGITPYIFKERKNRELLYLNTTTIDKIFYTINVKNEKTSIQRILAGLIEMNFYFIKNENTNMCRNLKNFSLIEFVKSNFIYLLEKIIIFIIYTIIKYKKYIIYKLFHNDCKKVFKKIYINLMDYYFV
jgi:predicted acylesterase/phospholipase RssA